jgi:hypothetical protein
MNNEQEEQAKVIGNIFNKPIAEAFLNLEKETVLQVQEPFSTPSRPSKKLPTNTVKI